MIRSITHKMRYRGLRNRLFVVVAISIVVLIYIKSSEKHKVFRTSAKDSTGNDIIEDPAEPYEQKDEDAETQSGCGKFDALDIFPKFNFSDAKWTNSPDYFWNQELEKRFQEGGAKFPLKIIVMPHSHNDPGWGWTIEQYFSDKTRSIMNNAVDKLMEYSNMTFQWSEASFMDIWWHSASKERRINFKKLVQDKRLEIVTGGWVMTDEAIVPLYSMIDQLIEGQHWVKYHLDVLPKVSWSADPFGLGSAFPFILKSSGINYVAFLRIHYAWKKWMAENRKGDFDWVQRWDVNQKYKMLSHQVFYTMYLIANSLGPHSEVCRQFHFTDNSNSKITDENLHEMATKFVNEAGRTGSLFEHNVALPILGADFTFRYESDWDNTYKYYMKLFNYINSNKDTFNTEISFGTLSDYFKAIGERQECFAKFSGDFFPYSDTVAKRPQGKGKTSYWSGYYTSRPLWKKMHREAENNVRTADILFTIMNAMSDGAARKSDETITTYSLLVRARQYLALFAHHDASPGVSSASVMRDYRNKLNEAIENSLTVQLTALETILSHLGHQSIQLLPWHKLSDPVRKYEDSDDKVFQFDTSHSKFQFLIFNSLGWERQEYVKLKVNSEYVAVKDSDGNFLTSQLNPVIKWDPATSATAISDSIFELVFLAQLPPLAIPTVFTIELLDKDSPNIAEKSKIVSNIAHKSNMRFEISEWTAEEDDKDGELLYIMNNSKIELGFSSKTGFLRSIKIGEINVDTHMKFGVYTSVSGYSGPYLFMADTSADERQIPFPDQKNPDIVAINGKVSSEILVAHAPIELLSVRILHEGSRNEKEAVFIQNNFDCKKSDGEYYMRFVTNLKSISENLDATFYTDQGGYTFEKRIKVNSIGVEGNYYPITTATYIQDETEHQRLTLLVDRSHGAASLTSGSFEVMIERRVPHDDDRGIGQGIMDNQLTTSNYILKLEQLSGSNPYKSASQSQISVPTLDVHHLSQSLIYPASIFIVGSSILTDPSKLLPLQFFDKNLPRDTVLLNIKTLPEFTNSDSASIDDPQSFTKSFSSNALFIFHKVGYSCANEDEECQKSLDAHGNIATSIDKPLFLPGTNVHKNISTTSLTRTDISGLRAYSSLFPGKPNVITSLDSISCHPFQILAFTTSFKT